MTTKFPTGKTVEARVHAALQVFIANDLFLLEHDANERAITHKLAEALQIVFRHWHVDCEYNRQGDEQVITKRLSLQNINAPYYENNSVVNPDIIIHRRGTEQNLLVIEVKKVSNATDETVRFDQAKLKAFRTDLKYKYALFIMFDTQVNSSKPYDLQWIS